ncbi:MAG: tape measure protein, partial [Acinetobacter sp.]|uniref:tape measure protein n=1 Tax=Acinetobacter sp. TaxID=472 RepID=UPI0025842D96
MTTNSLDFLLNLQANTSGFDQGINGAKFAVNALVGAMAALGMGLGVKELAEAADSYAMLSAKIQQSTKDSGNFEQAISGVHQIALQTNSTLDNTGALFTRLNTVAKDMGQSQQFALDMTSTVTKAIQLGGSSTQEAEAAVQQFIQAMQGGVLRGEEFNSIMEGGYGLAEALAKGLGVTTGELRKMAENGELSAERVLAALAKQKAGVDAQYAEMPTTISNALQKIATSWQILIGEMDQANGASATVAQWLSVLADNMGLLKPIIDDIGNGFAKFGAYLSDTYDQGAIDSLKTALVSIYDTIKTLFNTVLDVGRAFNDVFDDALSAVFSFTDGLRPAGVEVSGLQKAFDSLNIAINLIGDGFKAVGVVTNLFAGTLYRLAAVWYEVKATFTWGEVKKEAIANMTAMQNKSDEYFTKGFDGIKNYESQTVKSIENMGKTEDQKNADRIANNEKTLTDLKAQEAKHVSDYKAISDERIKLQQQLVDARKSGDQSAIDAAVAGLAELDKKEKAYQAESDKIQQAKIAAAQAVADATIKSADAAGQAELKALNAKLAAQGLKAEFDSTGKVVVSAMDGAAKATEGQSNATDKARKAATALGLDLDVSLNRVSEKFKAGETNVNSFVAGLEGLGAKGSQAANVTYEAWQKWAEQAKSPAEINAAKAKLIEFEKQGVLSAKQVEMGMRYLDEVNGKLPANISEVEKSYKLLGITSREEANKMAAALMKAFDVTVQSGTASAENIKQALINMADKIYASGDAAKIAWYEAKLSANGLQSSVDSLGKASVKSMDDLSDSVENVGRTASGPAADGFRELGRVAREEARSAADEWEAAMASAANDRKAFAAETKARGEALSKMIYEYDSYTRAEVEDKIRSLGYSEDKVKELANSIWSQGLSADSRAASNNSVQGVNGVIDAMSEAEFTKARKEGKTTQWGTNKINELLKNIGTSTASTSTSVSSP